MGDDEPTLLTGSPTRSYDSDGSAGPELEEIPLVGRRRLPGLANNPEQKATHYWVRNVHIFKKGIHNCQPWNVNRKNGGNFLCHLIQSFSTSSRLFFLRLPRH